MNKRITFLLSSATCLSFTWILVSWISSPSPSIEIKPLRQTKLSPVTPEKYLFDSSSAHFSDRGQRGTPNPKSVPVVTREKSQPELNREQIIRHIEDHGGDYSILGKIDLLQSDIVELDNGETHRQSVVRSSKSSGLVLVVEHFASDGQFIYTSFQSAERIIARVENEQIRHSIRSSLSAMGYSSEGESGWHELISVKVDPTPSRLFASKTLLESLVGDHGSVFFAGILPR